MNATTIVGYTYAADVYCSDCICNVLTSSEDYQGWKLGEGVKLTTEDNLSEIAAAFGIDRSDEDSFDSGEFPKVTSANMVHDGCTDGACFDICGSCCEPIGFDCPSA